MKSRKNLSWSALALAVLLLSACLGGGGDVTDPETTETFVVQIDAVDQEGQPIEKLNILANEGVYETDEDGKVSLTLDAPTEVAVEAEAYWFEAEAWTFDDDADVSIVGYHLADIEAAINAETTDEEELTDILNFPIFDYVHEDAMEYYVRELGEETELTLDDVQEIVGQVNAVDPERTTAEIAVPEGSEMKAADVRTTIEYTSGDTITIEIQVYNKYRDRITWLNESFDSWVYIGPGVMVKKDYGYFETQDKHGPSDSERWTKQRVTFADGKGTLQVKARYANDDQGVYVSIPHQKMQLEVVAQQQVDIAVGEPGGLLLNHPRPMLPEEPITVQMTDGYNHITDYNGTHQADVHLEVDVFEMPLLPMTSGTPVIDDSVLLRFENGESKFTLEETLIAMEENWGVLDMAEIATTIEIEDGLLEVQGSTELVVWPKLYR